MKIITVISPKDQPYQILMGEYYQVFFPLALLVSAAVVNPMNWIIVVIHIILFPVNVLLVISNIAELIRQEIMVKRPR